MKIKPYLILAAGVLVQLCLGSVYAWSVIGSGLRTDLGLTSSQTELIYGLSIGVFALGTTVTGRLVYRFGPRLMTLVSGLLFALSFWGASQSGGNPLLLTLTLGVVMGLGIAFGYVCPLTVSVAWFPAHKGLVTGLAVMGFGGGAVVSAAVIRFLYESGTPMLSILWPVGLVGGGAILLSALVLEFPPSQETASKGHAPRIHEHRTSFWKTGVFWALAGAMFLGTVGGLIVIGKITSIGKEYGQEALVGLALALLPLGNASGRLLWGALLDRLGTKAIPLSFGFMALGFFLLAFSPQQPFFYPLGALLTGLQFGASLVLYAAFSERYYGIGAIGRVYPYIFVFYGLAALLGPWTGGVIHDALGSYTALLFGLTVMALGGMVLTLTTLRSRKV